jgi:hypothetical protein
MALDKILDEVGKEVWPARLEVLASVATSQAWARIEMDSSQLIIANHGIGP